MQTNTKERILELLDEGKGSFVSSRTRTRARHLAQQRLQGRERATRRRTRDRERHEPRSSSRVITQYLRCQEHRPPHRRSRITVEFHDTVSSTNTVAKQRAEEGASEGTLIVANSQSAGRGRQGRLFSSPKDTGVYFTPLILRPRFALGDSRARHELRGVLPRRHNRRMHGPTCANQVGERRLRRRMQGERYPERGKLSTPRRRTSPTSWWASRERPSNPKADSMTKPMSPGRLSMTAMMPTPCAATSSPTRSIVSCATTSASRACRIWPITARALLDGRHVEVHAGIETFEAQVIGIDDDFTLRVRPRFG